MPAPSEDSHVLVGHYGIHIAHGMAFLHQKDDGTGEDLNETGPSPFLVSFPDRKTRCPHKFPLPAGDTFHIQRLKEPALLDVNPIIEAMLPKAQKKPIVGFVRHPQPFNTLHVFQTLAELSCPIYDSVVRLHANGGTLTRYVKEHRLTNIQPLVLVGFSPESIGWVDQILAAATLSLRSTILVGTADIPLAASAAWDLTEHYEMADDFVRKNHDKDLRAIGSAIMKEEGNKYAASAS